MKNGDFDSIEALIRSMLADGDSAESIAKEFTDALNKVEADRNGEIERDRYVTGLYANACKSFATPSSIDASTVVDVATIAIANKEKEMRRADLEEIHSSLNELMSVFDAFIEGDHKRVMELVIPKNLDVDAKIANFLKNVGLS